jgi:DNA-binding transcriptional ArsR family regulator
MALGEQAAAIEDMTYRRAEYTLKRARMLLGVSRQAHQILLLLLDHLTADSWRQGRYLVWPSNGTLSEDSGDAPRSVRAALAELERAGLVIRHYTPANRRMTLRGRDGGGIDLAPLAARFTEIEAAVARREDDRQERREAAWDRRQDIAWEEVETCHLEQSPINYPVLSVTGEGDPTGRNADRSQHEAWTPSIETSKTDERCSRGREGTISTEGQSEPTSLGETARARILAAIRLSPRLCQLAPLGEIERASEAAFDGILANAVMTIFPERNTDLTWKWLVQHNGRATAAEILVAAVEDPIVKEPSRWLGGFARPQKRPVDVSANLRRIRSLRAFEKSNDAPPPTFDVPAPWSRILARLSRHLDSHVIKAWLLPLSFAGVEGDVITLIASSAFKRDYIATHLLGDLERATRAEMGPTASIDLTL